MPLALLTPQAPLLPSTLVPLAAPTSNLHLVQSLSDLQLALLIAAARLEVLADTETVSFAMVYDEYLKLCAKTRVQTTPSGAGAGGGGGGGGGSGISGRVWSKGVAVGAWEGLDGMGLVVPVADGGGAGGRTRRGGVSMWRVDVGLMELRDGVRGTAWARWCREVV